MTREKTLLKNTLIMILGTFLPRIINLLTTPLINGSMSGGGYGNVELIQNTILFFIVPVLTLQVEQSLFRFIIDAKDEDEQKTAMTNGYMIIGLMMIIGAIITLFVPIQGFDGTYKLIIVLYIIVEVLSITSRFVLRAFSKYKDYSIVAALVVIVNFLVLSFNILVLDLGIHGVILALTVADIAGFLYVLKVCNIFKYINIKYSDRDYRRKILNYSLPFIPNQISWYINQMSDRWIISLFIGLTANGVYSMANKIPSIVNILYPAFNLAWTDSAQRSVNDADSKEYYNKMFRMLFCIVSAGSALLLGFTPLIFSILCRNPELALAINYTPVLIIATCFYCFAQFFGSVYVAIKETKNMAMTTTVAAVINIVINLLFMKQFGVVVAVISTLISNLFLFGYRYYNFNSKFFKLGVSLKITLFTIIIFIIISVLCLSNDLMLQIIGAVLSIGFAYFLSGDIFVDMIKKVLNKRKNTVKE